jgi:hypothetical protein
MAAGENQSSAPVKRKSRFLSKLLRGVRVILLAFAVLSSVGFASRIWSWAHSKNAPQEMAFEDYLRDGSDNDWLVLTGVYVDGDNRVETELVEQGHSSGTYAGTYYPLRTGPDDRRPVKVFLKPRNVLISGGGQVTLLEVGDPRAGATARAIGRNERQTVHALRQRGIDFSHDLEKALHACRLVTADEVVLVEQGGRPISTGEAAGMIAVLAGTLTLFGLTFLRRRESKA